jgi:hypothetical protein
MLGASRPAPRTATANASTVTMITPPPPASVIETDASNDVS